MIHDDDITQGGERRLVYSARRRVAQCRENSREKKRVMRGSNGWHEKEMRNGDEVEGGDELGEAIGRIDGNKNSAC